MVRGDGDARGQVRGDRSVAGSGRTARDRKSLFTSLMEVMRAHSRGILSMHCTVWVGAVIGICNHLFSGGNNASA